MASSSVPPSGGGGVRPFYQKFTTSGTFTLPDGYGAANPLQVQVYVIGGGGGGGNPLRSTSHPTSGQMTWNNYFGQGAVNINAFSTNVGANADASGTNNGSGGSGGLASAIVTLTANATITIGAGGTRGTTPATANGNVRNDNGEGPQYNSVGGSGGTTSFGNTISAAGGSGGTVTPRWYASAYYTYGTQNLVEWNALNVVSSTGGAGGNPAGTQGGATPLLGTIAGGASSAANIPIFGSYGVGGLGSDGNTSTGVDGTGGGANSIGASGAVILTWWA
jgi:hypothetical protein